MKTIIQNPLLNPLIIFISLVIVIGLLIVGKGVFIPFTLGGMCAFLLLPLADRLEYIGLPRGLATVLPIIGTIIVVAILGTGLSIVGSQFFSSLSSYDVSITNTIESAQGFVANNLGVSIESQISWLSENVNLFNLGVNNFSQITSSFATVLTTISLTFIYTFFILFYRKKFMTFLTKIIGDQEEKMMVTTLKKMTQIVPKYLAGVFFVVVVLTIINSVGLWLIGVPNPLFFGILVAALNIIPYLGPIIGFGLVILFSLMVAGPVVAIGALIFFIMVQFLENNIITPMVAGRTININPLAAIIGIIIGAKLWGIVGMIIALPLVGMIKIVVDNIPKLEALGYILGDEE